MALKACRECGVEISTTAGKCPHCGAKVNRIGCLGAIGILFMAAFIFVIIGYINQAANAPSSPPLNLKQTIRPLLSLDFTWSKAGFNNVMNANFTIKNNSDFDIKDIEVTCNHYSRSNTRIDGNTRTIYEIVYKHSGIKLQDFNMGLVHSQAHSSTCGITDFVVIN